MSETVEAEPVPSPRPWARLALFGSFVYLASQLLRSFPAAASRATGVSTTALAGWLPVAAGAGLVLLFAGLIASFWRVNRVVGHTAAGVLGLVGGTVGVFILGVFDLLGLFGTLGLQSPLLAGLGAVSALGGILGTFLALAGLAALGLGLTHALWVRTPGTPRRAAQESADLPSEFGSSGYRSY